MKVAIMQPYFFPYAGYFRLFSSADLFVVYDCVQFPRRGWVHRNRVLFGSQLQWVTLPIDKCPQDTVICDLSFRDEVDAWSDSTTDKLKLIANKNAQINSFDWSLLKPKGDVVDYLINTMSWCSEALGVPSKIIRSSSLGTDARLKAQDRIIDICHAVGADRYVNLPGGVSLYDQETFELAGIDLSFLPHIEGGYESILGRLLKEPISDIRQEIF